MTRNGQQRKLLVFTAPSGSGKTTVVRHLLDVFDQLAFSVSATTRERRDHERHGRDYYYLSKETFDLWVEEDAFVEWEEVYAGQKYGTPKFEIERLWALGKHVIFDIDVHGARNIQARYPEQTTTVFVKAPSFEILRARLEARKTESAESLRRRLEKVQKELSFEKYFDHVLINDDLDNTLRQARDLVAGIIGVEVPTES